MVVTTTVSTVERVGLGVGEGVGASTMFTTTLLKLDPLTVKLPRLFEFSKVLTAMDQHRHL